MSIEHQSTSEIMTIKQRGGNRYSEHLKNINADMGYNFTNWLTFTTDFDTEFILSALPNHSKLMLKEKFEKNMKQQKSLIDELKTLNESREDDDDEFIHKVSPKKSEASLIESQQRSSSYTDLSAETKMPIVNKFKKISTSLFMNKLNNNQSLFLKNKKKKFFRNNFSSHLTSNDFSKQNDPHSHFNFDDYFDKHHKISTNQNFRFSQLISYDQKNDENDSDDNFILQKVAPSRLPTNTNNGQIVSSSKTRLNYKLNSYKDNRFHPYNSVSFESITKPNEKPSSSGTGISSYLEGSNKMDSLKNLFNLGSYGQDDKNNKYLIWDNKVNKVVSNL